MFLNHLIPKYSDDLKSHFEEAAEDKIKNETNK